MPKIIERGGRNRESIEIVHQAPPHCPQHPGYAVQLANISTTRDEWKKEEDEMAKVHGN